MHTSAKLAVALAVTALVPATTVTAATRSACTSGSAKAAASSLFGEGTQLVQIDRIAGLRTALVLEPRIAPGTRRRMIAAGGRWCEASTGFNRAWRLAGRSVGDGRAAAEAYARLAAAPYFDGVTVTRTDGGVAGVWLLRTHALTNGVDARWVIVTDASGIRSAHWVATAFAQRPLEASWEGLTALPGASERYDRGATGRLAAARGLPTPSGASSARSHDEPGLLEHTFEDGFKIVTSLGDAHAGPNIGMDTGVAQADKLRATMRAAVENYEEFRTWGLEKGWVPLPAHPEDTGFIYVNDALSAYCLACVFISDDFQIHMLSEVQVALEALGYDGYRDRERAYTLIIGHEMFHNFQNAYNRPGHFNNTLQGGRGTPTSYSEGTARFQETLHTYADTTFAQNTLVTAQDANGCNGFDTGGSMDAGMAAGPFGKTYNTCFFWGPWYAAEGKEQFLDLVRETMPANSPESNAFLEIGRAVEQAGGQPIADQLARFAASSITGQGRVWPTWAGTEPVDWGSLFERWAPAPLEVGDSSSRTLAGGGMMANEITQDSRVSISGSDDAILYLVRSDGTTKRAKWSSVAVGAPSPGERVYALVVRPVAGSEAVTLAVGPPGKKQVEAAPASAPLSGSVTTTGTAPVRVSGVSSGYVEFEVAEGTDNARADVTASYPQPADIDLYLQRQTDTGTWENTGDSGASSALDGEEMATGSLPPGTYRIEVHNYTGPPGNEVSVAATFFNSAGEPGT